MEVNMDMGTDGETVVQTELSDAEYDRFRAIVQREGKTLKEALKEAANEYVEARARPDPEDPFFTHEPPERSGDDVTATKTDEYLYGEE